MTIPGSKTWHATMVLFICLEMAKETIYCEILFNSGIVMGTESHFIMSKYSF